MCYHNLYSILYTALKIRVRELSPDIILCGWGKEVSTDLFERSGKTDRITEAARS